MKKQNDKNISFPYPINYSYLRMINQKKLYFSRDYFNAIYF